MVTYLIVLGKLNTIDLLVLDYTCPFVASAHQPRLNNFADINVVLNANCETSPEGDYVAFQKYKWEQLPTKQ